MTVTIRLRYRKRTAPSRSGWVWTCSCGRSCRAPFVDVYHAQGAANRHGNRMHRGWYRLKVEERTP